MAHALDLATRAEDLDRLRGGGHRQDEEDGCENAGKEPAAQTGKQGHDDPGAGM